MLFDANEEDQADHTDRCSAEDTEGIPSPLRTLAQRKDHECQPGSTEHESLEVECAGGVLAVLA